MVSEFVSHKSANNISPLSFQNEGEAMQQDSFADLALHDFPILQQTINGHSLVYLDTAASALKPVCTLEQTADVYNHHYANIHRGLYYNSQVTTEKFEAVRSKIKRFLNVQNEGEIVFTRNTTEAINLVAQSWGGMLQEGDEIILSEMEHHANIIPWQFLEENKRIKIKVIPVTEEGALDLQAYTELLSEKTKLVSIVHISNSLGTVNDVQEIKNIAKNYNPDIRILVDGSQAVVHSPVDLSLVDPDFYVFTGHKLYAPTGIGVLYGKKNLLEAMPPYQGGGDMIETVSFGGSTFKSPPQKFEAGTPAFVQAIGLGAAVDYLSAIGMEKIALHEQALLRYAEMCLSEIPGLRFYGQTPQKAGIITFIAEWAHISDIAMILDQQGIAVRSGHHCCMPLMERYNIDGTVRVSFGLYNTYKDIDRLKEGLKKAYKLLT